jgi:hypothetical protein
VVVDVVELIVEVVVGGGVVVRQLTGQLLHPANIRARMPR